jgi:hypothetical protein
MTTPTMAEQLVPDEVWAAIQLLLPPKRPYPKGWPALDRRPSHARRHHLRAPARVRWRLLPAKQLGCGSRLVSPA